MGYIFGVMLTACGTRGAVMKNGRSVMIPEDVPMQKLKAELERVSGVAATDIVLAVPAGTTLSTQRKLRKSWNGTGLNIVRTLSSHTAIALAYAQENRFRAEELALVVECDGEKTAVSLLELSGDLIEELAFHISLAGDPAEAVAKVLEKAGHDITEVRAALLLDSEERGGMIRYMLRPGSRVVHYPRQTVAWGAAIYGGILSGGASAAVLRCVCAALGVETEITPFTQMVEANTNYPFTNPMDFQVPAGKTTLDVTILEESGERVELTSCRIGGIPAGTQTVTITLSMDANGVLRVDAGIPNDRSTKLTLTALNRSRGAASSADRPSESELRKLGAIDALLPVYDSLVLAVEHPTTDPAYKKGVEQILKIVTKQLSDLGVEPYGAVGDPFDPRLHNAVLHLPDVTRGTNEISRVFRQGFRAGSKILRFADVQVAN